MRRAPAAVPFDIAWARWIEHYGMDAWFNAAWPTADHIVPWGIFMLLWRQVPTLQATTQLNMMQAVQFGLGNPAWFEDGVRRLVERAFPDAPPQPIDG